MYLELYRPVTLRSTLVSVFAALLRTLPTHAAPTTAPATAASSPTIIVVTAKNPAHGGQSRTLEQAIEQAAADPHDNVIRFDPALFPPTPLLELGKPLVIDTRDHGHDRIDGMIGTATLTIHFSHTSGTGFDIRGTGHFTLDNLAIAGTAEKAIVIQERAHLRLSGVTLSGSSGPGVVAFDNAHVEIVNSRLRNHRTHGLEMHDRTQARLRNVQLSSNGQSAIAMFDQAHIDGQHCLAADNGDWNFVLTDRAHAELIHCVLAGAHFAEVDISSSARMDLDGCILDRGQQFGLFATGQATLALISTQVQHHKKQGIELQDAARLRIKHSHIRTSGGYGALLFGNTEIQATDTEFTENGSHGVGLRDSAGGMFLRCHFVQNRHSGITCADGPSDTPVEISRCLFQDNGLRPIARGPGHIAPLVPTPIHIGLDRVICLADAKARIELFVDSVGEAASYVATLQADERGQFTIPLHDIPDGHVVTATATITNTTSEFNVVAGAGAQTGPILHALLAQTGPLSDCCNDTQLQAQLRRWPRGTRLVFHLHNPPTPDIERYAQFACEQIANWTQGQVAAEMRIGRWITLPPGAVVIPVRWVPSEEPTLAGRGGLTFLKWMWDGSFAPGIEILLAYTEPQGRVCPPILGHEIGHTLGLNHVRVGLLSRMQGSIPPNGTQWVNDFSAVPTFYDVLALQLLYNRSSRAGITLGELVAHGLLPHPTSAILARATASPSPSDVKITAPPNANMRRAHTASSVDLPRNCRTRPATH